MKKALWVVFTVFLAAGLILAACAQTPAATSAPTSPAVQPTSAEVSPAATEMASPTTTEGALAPSAAPSTAAGSNTITVATDATWPPFEIVDESTKQIVGMDIDLMNAIAEKAGLTAKFVNVAFDPLLAGMADCQYDVAISSITITPERQKQMLFSDPYFDAGQVVTVTKDNTTIKSKDDLSGKTVGAQIGTTGAIWAQKQQGVTLKTYDTVDLAFQDLMNGQIDAVIADNPLALGFVGKNPDKMKIVGNTFTTEQYGIAICKNRADLVPRINKALAEVKAAGTIDQLSKKWLGTVPTSGE